MGCAFVSLCWARYCKLKNGNKRNGIETTIAFSETRINSRINIQDMILLHVQTQRSFYKSKGIYNRVNKTSLFVLCTHLIDQKKHLTRSNSTIYNKNHGYYYSHRYSCSKITHHACDLFWINHRKKRRKKTAVIENEHFYEIFIAKRKKKKKKINRGEERKKEREGKRNLNSRISANRFSSNFSRKFRPRFRTSTTHLEVIKRN